MSRRGQRACGCSGRHDSFNEDIASGVECDRAIGPGRSQHGVDDDVLSRRESDVGKSRDGVATERCGRAALRVIEDALRYEDRLIFDNGLSAPLRDGLLLHVLCCDFEGLELRSQAVDVVRVRDELIVELQAAVVDVVPS